MPITLITGPANAAKAGVVLQEARNRAARSPLLVVPTYADVERYRRELAEDQAALGVRVERFAGLERELARRAGVPAAPLTDLQRERVAAAAVAAAKLDQLADAAATSGFVPALVRFADELAESRIDPPRFIQALRAWAGNDSARRAYAEELGRLVAEDRRLLQRVAAERGAPGGRIQVLTAALDRLRLEPARWGGTPVLLYGFDDFTPLQRDVLDTLGNAVDAEVIVSLTFEPGRAAFAARATLHQELLALGATERRMEAVADYYAEHARPVLHHLERNLFEPDRPRVAVDRDRPAVLALEGGGERAEIELVAAEVARLIAAGTPPEEIAVVHRGLDQAAPLLDEVFRGYRIPVAIDRRLRVGHTAIGRGLIALLRCALLDGDADELLAWLRTPGLLRNPGLADGLEARVRRCGARTATDARAEARKIWEDDWALEPLDELAAAHREGGTAAVVERLAEQTRRLLGGLGRGEAPVLDHAGAVEARVAARVLKALGELAALPADLQGGPAELASTIGGLTVHAGAPPGPGRVTITRPQDLRARRVRALFCCGLQEGVFPAQARPEPFLSDAERRELNAASGLRLRLDEDALAIERLFFYAVVSRPTELLALSWHAADDEGGPSVRSFFVDDVADLLDEEWALRPKRRELGAAGWPPDAAPTRREAARHAAAAAPPADPEPIGPLRSPAVLGPLRERNTWSASDIEAWTACPVRWFVDRLLRLEALVPDPEPLVRGNLAHLILERALSRLVADGIGLVPERLPEARRLVAKLIAEHADDFPISTNPERARGALRRLEADLIRYLEWAAHSGTAMRPHHFELKFGQTEDPHPALELDDGAVRLSGRIDRVDVGGPDGRHAVVYDYKGRTAVRHGKWLEEGKLQVALYMLAVRRLLRLEPVGGFYQPLGAPDPRPRGALLKDADPEMDVVGTDRLDEDALEELLEACAKAASETVAQIRSGALAPNPERCTPGGGCAHPTICRCTPA